MRGELENIPERHEGYRESIIGLAFDIQLDERAHDISKTQIVLTISKKIHALGKKLHELRTAKDIGSKA